MKTNAWMTAIFCAACSSSAAEPSNPSSEGAEPSHHEHAGHDGHQGHSAGPASCDALAKACHDVGHDADDAGKCHEIGHKGDAATCDKEQERCLALCAEKAKAGEH